jgi:excisionase family DNA binding protein
VDSPALPQLLTPEQVASLCGYSRKAIYRAIERGELRATKRCSRWRLWPSDVEHWLEEGVHSPPAVARSANRPSRTPTRSTPRGSFRALLVTQEENTA